MWCKVVPAGTISLNLEFRSYSEHRPRPWHAEHLSIHYLTHEILKISIHTQQHSLIMPPSYTISNALPSDASAISSLFALSWQSPFSRLQFGNVEPRDLAKAMKPRIAQQIAEKRMLFMVAREEKSGNVVSVAQWTVPPPPSKGEKLESKDKGKLEETGQEKKERKEREAFDEEIYLNSLPASCNTALIAEFAMRVRVLRERIVQCAPHFLLENLATHPGHRGQGLAARLIRHVLDVADQRSVVVYLETGEENKARELYGRLGFEEKGREGIKLKKFASREERERMDVGDVHTVIAYVRVPCRTT